MKTKITAKFLLPVVLVIWGLIGWKVYAVMKGKDDPVSVHAEPRPVLSRPETISDSVHLVANYRDPFLDKMTEGRNPKSGTHPVKSNSTEKKIAPEKNLPVWPKLNYYGLVKRSTDGKTVGFLNANDASYFIRSGDLIGDLKILRLWKDSVEVNWLKEKRIVRK